MFSSIVGFMDLMCQKLTLMKISFLSILHDSFTEQSYQTLSRHLAISTDQAKDGVHVIIPIVLASILENNTSSNAVQPIWWNALSKEFACNEDKTMNISIISKPFFDVKGRGVSWYIFRYCYNDLVALVSEKAIIQKKNAENLIELTTPLIAGYLINWLVREGWDFDDLISNLLINRHDIIGALPVGIAPVHLGINGLFFG